MNRRSILTKTGKGLMEATGKTSNLSRDLRNILKEIDGKVSVSELLEKFGKMPEPRLLEALSGMAKEGYLREFVGKQDEAPRAPAGRAPAQSSADGGGEDLDFTAFTPAKPSAKTGEDARLQAQAQEIARQAQATRAREQAAAKARAEAAARAKAGAEQKARLPAQANPKADAQARAQAEALDQARREAEERQRREAEARARIAAEQSAKRGAEERILREIQEKERREGEVRAERESEERARSEEEERPGREEEQRRRAEEDASKRREAEESEALERSLREQEEKARREAEQSEREEEQRREEEERARRESEEEAQGIEEEKKRAKEEERRAREDEKAQAKAAARTAKAARSKEKAGEEAWRGDEEARDSNEASLSAREIWAKRKPGSLAKQFAVMLLVILIVAVAALPFVPLERGPYEKAAQAWLGEPVTLGSVNLALLPVPLLKFEKIVIGKQPQMRAAVIKAIPVITSLLEDPISLKSLELENVTFPREFLPALLQDKG